MKLPSGFPTQLLDRVGGVVRGSEPLPGFSDAAVKRSFAEAYTAFSVAITCYIVALEITVIMCEIGVR